MSALEQAAIEAARLCSEASVQLLRYAQDGNWMPSTVFEEDVPEKLGRALQNALGIDPEPVFDLATQPEHHAREIKLRTDLLAAVEAYLTEAPL